MPWKKANTGLIKLLEYAMTDIPGCERRMMFGSPTFFINNNMFAGVHEDTVILRLSEADRKELFSLYKEATPFTPMGGHVMKEYAALPETVCHDEQVFKRWLGRSYQYASALPPKETARRKKG